MRGARCVAAMLVALIHGGVPAAATRPIRGPSHRRAPNGWFGGGTNRTCGAHPGSVGHTACARRGEPIRGQRSPGSVGGNVNRRHGALRFAGVSERDRPFLPSE
jgi:hypothetical protein